MAERIVLDPSEVATSRTAIDVTPWVDDEGIDWGDAEIAAYMADQTRGSSPVDFRVPNRTITIPLVLKTVGGTTFAQVRTNIQAKAAIFQREGGWIKRLTSSGSAVFADVVNATLKLGGGWGQAHRGYDTDASLVLEALPDFYGAEVQLADHTETAAAELVFTETNIQGDYPARTRIVVDDDSGEAQLGLLWGLRSRHYSSAATAAPRFEAEALTPMDTATRVALGGASGGTVVTHGTLSTNWTPVLNTNIGGTQFLTHTGTNRLFARYRTTSGTAVQLRAVWDVGDLTRPIENTTWNAVAGTAFHVADLGELRLDPSPVGAHRWQGQIQGKGELGTENLSVDRVWVVNADEGFGRLMAPFGLTSGLSPYSARDEFNHTAGTLTGKVAPVGGAWTADGSSTAFIVNATSHDAERTTISDSGVQAAISGVAAISTQTAQVDITQTGWSAGGTGTKTMGLMARYVDTANHLRASLVWQSGVYQYWAVDKVVANVSTTLAIAEVLTSTIMLEGVWYSLRLFADVSGRWSFWFYRAGSALPITPTASGQDADLAPGGALDDGKAGFRDFNSTAEAATRSFDNFLLWAPSPDAVIYPSRTVQIATDGVRRLDTGGTAYGPVASVLGDLPRLPVAGLEGRTTEVFLKGSRGDFAQISDIGIDDISARVNYRPCWLFVP